MTETIAWHPMTSHDLGAVVDIAAAVHTDYPEDPAVFIERLAKAPAGCFMLKNGPHAIGYIISHPWYFKQPPKLNALLGALPDKPDTYYIHDLALLPQGRGAGWGKQIVTILCDLAQSLEINNLSLVAVNKSVAFWQSKGFEILNDLALSEKLQSYDADACFMIKHV